MTITLKSSPDGVSGAIQVNGNDAVIVGSQGITQGAPASFRNKIINGKMEIAQRGAAFISTANTYVIDRWLVDYVADGGATTTQSTDVPSSNELQNSLRITQNAADTFIAASQYARFEQRIEGFNARDLIGRTFTISFWVRSSKTGIHCVSLRNAAVGNSGDRSYIAEYAINSANTWEFKTITVSGGLITDGANWNWTNGIGLQIGFTIACGSTFQTTANAWQTGNFLATANQVNCLDTVGNIFAITGVQLEAGSVATPFEHRPYGLELSLCRNYYREMHFGIEAYGVGGQFISQSCVFDGPMRATPTVVEQFIGGNNVSAIDLSAVNKWYVWYKLTWSSSGPGYRMSILKVSAEL